MGILGLAQSLLSFGGGAIRAGAAVVSPTDPLRAGDPVAAAAASTAHLAAVSAGWGTAVCLSGGGAWGFVHAGLLRYLETRLPSIDVVTGSSSGALVAAFYAWQPDPSPYLGTPPRSGLDELEARRWELAAVISVAILSLWPAKRWVRQRTGGIAAAATPVPFRGAFTDVATGQQGSVTGGDLGDAVGASGAFPWLFAPQDVSGHAVIDGMFSGNLALIPAWALGASFFVSSNCMGQALTIVKDPLAQALLGLAVQWLGPVRRTRDLVYGVLYLCGKEAENEARAFASVGWAPGTTPRPGVDWHLHVRFQPRCWTPIHFWRGDAVAKYGEKHAKWSLSGSRDPLWAWIAFVLAKYGYSAPPPPPPAGGPAPGC